MVEFMKALSIFILPLGLGSKRFEFFKTQVRKLGGTLVEDNTDTDKVTHIMVDDSVCQVKENCLPALKKYNLQPPRIGVKYLKISWLCKCLRNKALVDVKPFTIDWIEREMVDFESDNAERIPEKRICNEVEEKGNDIPDKKQKIDVEKFICSKPSSSYQKETSQIKKLIIEELEKLANAYTIRNDTWRSHGYRKAINAIMLHDKDITTFQEACSIPGVGEKTALKIMEIIESGKLKKVEEIVDEKTRILDGFCKIWGVGPTTAESWYVQGFRTLDDLKNNGKLSKQQKIGLKHYEEFQKRIPREEVIEIAEIIEKEVLKVDSTLKVELVGSFRRGKPNCGDVDVMIVNSGLKTPLEILLQVTDALKTQGYITDDLVGIDDFEDTEEGNHRKYFGVFKLPGSMRTHRRLDLFVVPKREYASALFHYTGSAMFNRSVKLLAAKKGMTLTEHGLYCGTVRKGSEVRSKGQLVSTLTEEDIFKDLGLAYRGPEERDHSQIYFCTSR